MVVALAFAAKFIPQKIAISPLLSSVVLAAIFMVRCDARDGMTSR